MVQRAFSGEFNKPAHRLFRSQSSLRTGYKGTAIFLVPLLIDLKIFSYPTDIMAEDKDLTSPEGVLKKDSGTK